MALYEITLEQSYYGQQIINRWNYQSGSIPSGSSGSLLLIAAMGFSVNGATPALDATTIAGKLKALQVAAAEFIQVIAKNLYSVTDFYTYAFPPGTHGTVAGVDGLSPTAAWGYTTDRTRADIRRGQKRFVGIPESQVSGGGELDPASLSTYQALGDAMAAPVSGDASGSPVTFTPYVFGRQKYTAPSGHDAYRYYATESEQLDHIALITAFALKQETRTQVSRQYGRGK